MNVVLLHLVHGLLFSPLCVPASFDPFLTSKGLFTGHLGQHLHWYQEEELGLVARVMHMQPFSTKAGKSGHLDDQDTLSWLQLQGVHITHCCITSDKFCTTMYQHRITVSSYMCITIQARSHKILLGVVLKEMWTFSYCSHSANHSPGAVDKLIIYGVCIAYIHESIDHVKSFMNS